MIQEYFEVLSRLEVPELLVKRLAERFVQKDRYLCQPGIARKDESGS